METAPSRLGMVLLTTLLITLAGCASPEPATIMSPSAGPTSSPSPTVDAAPGSETTVNCAMSRPLEDSFPVRSDDLALGPLVYRGLRHGYPGNPPRPAHAQEGIIFAKFGTELSPDATVTVSVAPEARSWASIVTEAGPPAGYFSVTYKSCTSAQNSTGVWWVGGFALRNQTSGCLPLNVQVDGESSVRHAVISFWDEGCA